MESRGFDAWRTDGVAPHHAVTAEMLGVESWVVDGVIDPDGRCGRRREGSALMMSRSSSAHLFSRGLWGSGGWCNRRQGCRAFPTVRQGHSTRWSAIPVRVPVFVQSFDADDADAALIWGKCADRFVSRVVGSFTNPTGQP